jgi:hypothetical protein
MPRFQTKTDDGKEPLERAPAPIDDTPPRSASAAPATEATEPTGEKPAEPEKAPSRQDDKRADLVALYRQKAAEDRKVAKARVRVARPQDDPDGDGDGADADAAGAAAGEQEATQPGGGRRAPSHETPEEIEAERAELRQRAEAARGKPADRRDAAQQDGGATGQGEVELRDGKRVVKVSQEEALRLAQIAFASDNRLDESKRILKDAIEVARTLRGDAGTEHPPGQAQSPGTQTASSPQSHAGSTEHPPGDAQDDEADLNELEDLVDKIQVGDRSEGANALKAYEQRIIERARQAAQGTPTQPAALADQVRSVLSQDRIERENQTALQRFADTYPDLAKDELLAQAGLTALGKEIEKDLARVGVEDEIIASIRGNTHALVAAHKQLRMAGHKVSAPDELFDAVGSVMTERFGIRKAAGGNGSHQQTRASEPGDDRGRPDARATYDRAAQDRLDRKRQLTPQPRAAGVRSQMPQAPRPKTAREILEEQRVRRGYSRTA